MNRSGWTAACVAIALLWAAPSSAWAQDAGLHRETRIRNLLRETLVRTVDPAVNPSPDEPIADRSPAPLDATGALIWGVNDAAGMMNNVGMSDDGSVVAIAVDLNDLRLDVYNGQTGALSYTVAGETDGWNSVAVSAIGSRIAYATGSMLYFLNSVSATPIWTTDSPYFSRVGISPDGQKIIGLEGDLTGNADSVSVWCFSAVSNIPVWNYRILESSLGGFMGAVFSADGTHLVVSSRYRIFVLNPSDGSLIAEIPAFNMEQPASVSGDGRVITCGSNNSGKISVYHWDSAQQNYLLLWTYTFSGGQSNWATATAVSANGETVAGGSMQFTSAGGYEGYIAVFETYGGGVPLWTPVAMGDYISGVDISDDGLTVAAISWGVFTGTAVPDIQVFDKYNAVPFFTYSHVGSPNALALNPGGTRLFTGGKGAHNRQFGMGGQAYMFSLDLEGGTISGTVTLQSTTDHSGVTVEIADGSRRALTDSSGTYQIRHVPAGSHTVRARKLGYTIGTASNVVVTDGGTTPNVNFALNTVGAAPTGLTATQTLLDHIQLAWAPVTLAGIRERERERRIAAGDEPYIDRRGPVAITDYRTPFADRNFHALDDADSIRVWRSSISGGPYTPIAALPGTAITYSDTLVGIRPGVNYYYAITAVYPLGESQYSNQAMGLLEDNYLNYMPNVPPKVYEVSFDGVITPGEWTDAIRIDISDVIGYDAQNAPGTAYIYMKYDDTLDLLLIATEDHANPTLEENEGMGFYVDDDFSRTWTYEHTGHEGNYWAYYYTTGSTLRYRSLTGGEYGSNYYIFPNPQIGFSDVTGCVTMEVAIPMGFHHEYDIALYGPNLETGIGAFVISRIGGNPIFNGWWPQNMPSIVSNPDYFASAWIPAQLFVPPQSPANVTVINQSEGIVVSWTDPALGVDHLPLTALAGIAVYRNGEMVDIVDPGTQVWVDIEAAYGGWYEYSLTGFIDENGDAFEGPPSYPVGIYAGVNPDIDIISYDDGEWDVFMVPSFTYEDNKFAVQFDRPEVQDRVYTVQLMTNSTAPIGVGVHADQSGLPGARLVGPYWVSVPITLEFFTFHFPGTMAPVINQDVFWVVLEWPQDSPGDPGVATDTDPPYNARSWHYLSSTGWVQDAAANFMIRAGMSISLASGDLPPAVAHEFRLLDNYPNPFNPTTTIPFELAADGDASLTIYNVVGQRVATLIDAPQTAGYHVVPWNGCDDRGLSCATGVYLVRLESRAQTAVRKIMLLR